MQSLREIWQRADRRAFLAALRLRIEQLRANMVDGAIWPEADVAALRAELVSFVGDEVLPAWTEAHPKDALALLDLMKAFKLADLEGARRGIEAARAKAFAPPAPLAWPELADVRRIAAETLAPPVDNVAFAAALKDDGLPLPDELLALYATCDGFSVEASIQPGLCVFSLLPSNAIDVLDAESGYPRRAVVFEGLDDEHLSVFLDATEGFQVVFEYAGEPVAARPLDLRALLRFGTARASAPSTRALFAGGDLSWDVFFEARR